MNFNSIRNRLIMRTPNRVKAISQYLAKFGPEYFSRRLENPFFIIGCNRSGTTLLVDTLATHPEIATYPDEANELWHPQTFPWRNSPHNSYLPPIEVDPEKFTLMSLKYRTVDEEKKISAVFGAYQFVMDKKRFLNKSAMIAFMVPYILGLIPEAKFIHIVRDGRGVVRSWTRKLKRTIRENQDLYTNYSFGFSPQELMYNTANTWNLHVEEIEKQKKQLKLEEKGIFLEFRYEDFCRDPHSHLIQISKFIGISPNFYIENKYDHIQSMNYKYREEFDEVTLTKLTKIMEVGLRQWKYL